MKRRRRAPYHMLVASLPALPRIGIAERLPINPARLESRLRMLTPEDAEIVARIRRFIQWQNQSHDRTDAEVAREYRKLLASNPHASVQAAITFRMNIRTIFAAMRRRHRGESQPPDEEWGAGNWVRHIEKHWSHPEFKLNSVFPWISQAREHFENGETLQLEELLMELVWDALDRRAFGRYFEFENIIAYLFKWDILQRWLSYREEAARQKFEELATALFLTSTAPSPKDAAAA